MADDSPDTRQKAMDELMAKIRADLKNKGYPIIDVAVAPFGAADGDTPSRRLTRAGNFGEYLKGLKLSPTTLQYIKDIPPAQVNQCSHANCADPNCQSTPKVCCHEDECDCAAGSDTGEFEE